MAFHLNSVYRFFASAVVTHVTLSSQECVKALSQYETMQHGFDISSIAQNIEDLQALTLPSAEQRYTAESVKIDMQRDSPAVEIFENNQLKAAFQSSDMVGLKEILNSTFGGGETHRKKVNFFSHLASQNVMSSGVNLVNGLCLATNEQWVLKTAQSKTAVKLSVKEDVLSYTKRVAIESIRAPDKEMGLAPVIHNQNGEPIAFATTSLTISSDATNEPRHRITYAIESNNKQFCRTILQPLDKKMKAVRNEQSSCQAVAPQEDQDTSIGRPAK